MTQEVSSQPSGSAYGRANSSDGKDATATFVATRKLTKGSAIEWAERNRDMEWTLSNHRALVAKYPDKSIAVHNCEVVANADTIGELLRAVDLLGIPRSNTFMKFMNADPMPIIPSALASDKPDD